MGSSKARDQSAMMQPGWANVGAAMIAHGAEHRVAHSNLEIIIVALETLLLLHDALRPCRQIICQHEIPMLDDIEHTRTRLCGDGPS
jgi:hypothetical protein